ncbi:MAG: hypothetical protein ACRDRH_08180 [Pseudonocardia sp.]
MDVVRAETTDHIRVRLAYERVQNALTDLAHRWPDYQNDPIARELVRWGYVVLESYLNHPVDEHGRCARRGCRRRWASGGRRRCSTHRTLSCASATDLSTVWWQVLIKLPGQQVLDMVPGPHANRLATTRAWLARCATDDD